MYLKVPYVLQKRVSKCNVQGKQKTWYINLKTRNNYDFNGILTVSQKPQPKPRQS